MRLIDADEFKLENKRLLHCDFPYLSEVTLEELIDDAPTVDVVSVKHGYWKHTFDGFVECSNCGTFPLLDGERKYVESEYCSCCGAKMDEKIYL